MSDYRKKFYANYHIVSGTDETLNEDHYKRVARQHAGRWQKWLPADRSSRCLCLACGNGEFLYWLKSAGYENIYGVDLNEIGLAHTQRIGISNIVQNNAIEYLKTQTLKFDLISALNFFEHLTKSEILELLGLIYGALNPGGRLIVITPNGLSPFSGTTRYWDFSHETSFTPASWRQLARLSGFSSAVFEEHGPIPHSVKGKIRILLWQLIRLIIMAVSYVEVGSPRDVSKVYTADMHIILTKGSIADTNQ